MLEGSFFVFMTVAILSFGIQGSFQTIFARRYDSLTVTLYRNLSLGVTMLPVLFMVPYSDIVAVTDHLGTVFLASSTGAFSLVCSLASSRYLPIGIASALRQLTQVFVAVFLGVLVLHELITMTQLLVLGAIITCGVALTLLRTSHDHLDPSTVWKGVGLTVLAGFSVAYAFFYFSILAREIHPFAAGYFWEVGVGICALVYFLGMRLYGKAQISTLRRGDALNIVVVSLLTVFGTISYASAVNHGPYALASGLLTMTVLVTSVMGWILYRERLTKAQMVLVAVAVLLMILMKFVT